MSTEVIASDKPIVSRSEAISTGQTWYHTGKPCKHGHIANRQVASRNCATCADGFVKAYREANRAVLLARSKAFRGLNPELCAAMDKAWRDANPDKVRFMRNDWGRKNPDKVKIMNATQHHHRRTADGKFTAADIREIHAMQRGKCAYCKVSIKKKYHVDHIVPIKLGGTNDRKNLQLLCQPCNQRKGAMHPVEFSQKIGLLL